LKESADKKIKVRKLSLKNDCLKVEYLTAISNRQQNIRGFEKGFGLQNSFSWSVGGCSHRPTSVAFTAPGILARRSNFFRRGRSNGMGLRCFHPTDVAHKMHLNVDERQSNLAVHTSSPELPTPKIPPTPSLPSITSDGY
jgi:hypothetical protein